MNEKQWTFICHLSGLCGYIIPFGNLIVPLIIWSAKKDEMPLVDAHGKEALNFQISITLYLVVSMVFIMVFIGIFMLMIVAILNVTLVIIAAIKADSGELYHYPLSIRFIK